MLLTITTTYRPATDLGYLLHKNPARCQEFELSFGKAHVFYPQADEDQCTAAKGTSSSFRHGLRSKVQGGAKSA